MYYLCVIKSQPWGWSWQGREYDVEEISGIQKGERKGSFLFCLKGWWEKKIESCEARSEWYGFPSLHFWEVRGIVETNAKGGTFFFFFSIHGLDYGIRLPCSLPCTKPRTWPLVNKLGGMVTVSFPILYGGILDCPSWRGEKLAKLRVAYCDKGRGLYIREHELLIYTKGEKEDMA